MLKGIAARFIFVITITLIGYVLGSLLSVGAAAEAAPLMENMHAAAITGMWAGAGAMFLYYRSWQRWVAK